MMQSRTDHSFIPSTDVSNGYFVSSVFTFTVNVRGNFSLQQSEKERGREKRKRKREK